MSIITDALHNTTDTGREFGSRVAQWCRAYDYKTLARMFQVSPRTADGWRQGSPPSTKHLYRMVALWGDAFLQDVFAPVLQEADDDLDRRLERIERDLQATRRAINEQAQADRSEVGGQSGRMVRTVRAARRGAGIALCMLATSLAMTADNELRNAQAGRYGGRPPVVRVSRGGREA